MSRKNSKNNKQTPASTSSFAEEKPSEFAYSAAHLFIECLEDEGVELIFGLPGEENADFVMALSRSKKIKFVLVRHEQGLKLKVEQVEELERC